MNDLANPHENIEKVNDKLLAESFSILGPTLSLFQTEEIDEDKDGSFGQPLQDIFCHNFDHSVTADANFSGGSQVTSFNAQNGKYSCKSKMENFAMFNKLWPDQLDILAGPLLEGDDDITDNDSYLSHKHSLNSGEIKFTPDYEQALILNNSLKTEIETKAKMLHLDSITFKRNAAFKFGNIVRISKDEDTAEEIDVVTVDEDSSDGDGRLDNKHCFKALNDENNESSNSSVNVPIENCSTDSQRLDTHSFLSAFTEDRPKAVLEAPDLDSLLEQFEATEDCIQPEKDTTNCHRNRLTDTVITPGLTPKGNSTSSFIERIKSSTTPSRGTILISHETVLKSSSPSRLKIDNVTQCCNSVTSKKSATPISKTVKELITNNSCTDSNTVSSSDDHDYCSPLPASNGSPYFSKIPDYLTELKPRKNSGHNTILRKVLLKKDNMTDKKHFEEVKNANAESSFQISNDTQLNVSDSNLLKAVPSDLPTVSTALEDESLSSFSSGFSENSNNLKCQLLENIDVKELCPPSESLNVSNSPEIKTSGVIDHVDFHSSFQHDQSLAKHYSSSISSSPSHSPPPKWLPLRRSRSRSPPFEKHTGKLKRRVRNGCRQNFRMWEHKEKLKQIEERRVLYVGNIPEGMTRADLRERFGKFGPIHEVSIHIREFDDNYAFVTFCNRNDAYMAVEHGNDDPNLPRFELSFGGRRQFCKVKYADLDSQYDANERRDFHRNYRDLDFDSLLKDVKAQFKSKHLSPRS